MFSRPSSSQTLFEIVTGEASRLWTQERQDCLEIRAVKAKEANDKVQEMDRAPPGSAVRKRKFLDEVAKKEKCLSARGKVQVGSIVENARKRICVSLDARICVYMKKEHADEGDRCKALEQLCGKRVCVTTLASACQHMVTHCFVPCLADIAEDTHSM